MKKRMYNAARSEQGFTLVELAVVMIIIGLLVGGILKGQEMIANAQVTSTVAQIKSIDAATGTFRDVYDAMPGDIANAGRLANCTVAPCTTNGNGNNQIATAPFAAVAGANEAGAFFSHLQAAELVTNVNVNGFVDADITGNEIQVGYTNGAAAVGLLDNPRAGNYLTLTSTGTAAGAGLKPLDAARMDRKIDDGDPTTGSAGGNGGNTCGTAVAADGTGGYVEATSNTTCSFLVRIQG